MMNQKQSNPYHSMQPRGRQINLRLSDAEYEKLSQSSALYGLGRAAYLRMILLEKWRSEERGETNFLSVR